MNVLEKILEEINEKIKFAERMMVEKPCDKLDEIANDTAESFISAYEACGETIRSHMDEIPNCEGCSRRKWYQKGFEDGKKDIENDGWIPVRFRETTDEDGIDKEEFPLIIDCHMPEDGEEIIVTYKNGTVAQDTCFNDDGYYLDSGNDWLDDVLAWQPLPERYIKNPK